MNKQTKPKKFVTVRLDAKLAKSLEKDGGDLEIALNGLFRSRVTGQRTKRATMIPKKVVDSHNAFLEKYGSLSVEFGTL